MASLVIGFALNYAVNALFGKDQEGPRLTDLKLQGSSYGVMEPIVYGMIRLAGNVIWQTDLTEHKNVSGGKGGPKVTTYTYTASFDVEICGNVSKQVRAIWADKQLIWDIDNPAFGDVPCKFYYGLETQLPDPTEESILGVGNVPAYRGITRAVFTDYLLSNYGNRIPTLEFLVVTSVGPIPWRVYTYAPEHAGAPFNNQAFILAANYENGLLTIGQWNSAVFDPNYTLKTFDLDGTAVDTLIDLPSIPDFAGGIGMQFMPCINTPHIAFAAASFAGNQQTSAWFVDGAFFAGPLFPGFADDIKAVLNWPYLKNENLYAPGGPVGSSERGHIFRWPCPSNFNPQVTFDASYSFNPYPGITGQPSDSFMIQSDDDFIWVVRAFSNSSSPILWKFDLDLNLVQAWTVFNVPPAMADGSLGAVIYQGNIAVCDTTNAATVVYSINDDGTFTQIGTLPVQVGSYVYLGTGLVLVPDGVISLNPPPTPISLADIVSDISVRDGLSTSQIDVTALEPYTVPGYMITQQMPGRDAISPLQFDWFFDAVEQDNQVVFVVRGGPSMVTIPDEDLATVSKGGQPPAQLIVERTQEVDIPATVYHKYLNTGAAYQTGTQQSQRLVTTSQLSRTVDAAVAIDDKYAKHVCDVNLIEGWIRRDKGTFYTSREYGKYMPTDVVTVRGRTWMIIDRRWVSDTTIEFTALATLSQLYVQSAGIAGAASGYRPPPPPPGSQETELRLLDIPLVTDADASNGFYAAMAGAVSPNWSGAGLYKSIDGTDYVQLLIDQTGDVMGTTVDALGDFTGGNIFDESNSVTLTVGPGGGDLSSFTMTQVLNGAGIYLIGSELIGVKNATLNIDGTYTLTGLWRGQRGTEWAMPGHVANERWNYKPASANPPALFSEIGLPRYYEALTIARSTSSGTPQIFTNTGNALKCYAPVQLGGGTDSSGNVTMTAYRRTRIGARFMAPSDVPLSEATPLFIWEVRDATFMNVAKIIQTTSVTVPLEAIISAADQLALFSGSQLQLNIYFSIGQVGSNGIGQRAYGVAGGGGVSNTSIIAPIPQYASPAPGSGGGGGGGGVNPPSVSSTFNWTTPVTIFSGGLTPDLAWVVKVTPNTTPPGVGTMTFAEYGGGPIQRQFTLSDTPFGLPLTPSCSILSTTGTFPFYMSGNPGAYYPTLVSGTDYYVTIITSQDGAMYGILEKPH